MYAPLSKLVVRPPKPVVLIPICSFARLHRTPLSRSGTGTVSASKPSPQPSNDDNHENTVTSTSSSSTVTRQRPEGTGIGTSSSTTSVPSVASSSSSSPPSWNWVPPRIQSTTTTTDNEAIPVVPGVLLNSTEIQVSLQAQGAENVLVIPLNPKLESIGEFVLATGRSSRHLRKMADSIVSALKARRLNQALGCQGAEGEKNDDWLLIDAHNIVVHLMLPHTRRSINLEGLWLTEPSQRPSITFSRDEDVYEKNFETLLEKYPVPEEYLGKPSSSSPSISSFGMVKEREEKQYTFSKDTDQSNHHSNNSNSSNKPRDSRFSSNRRGGSGRKDVF